MLVPLVDDRIRFTCSCEPYGPVYAQLGAQSNRRSASSRPALCPLHASTHVVSALAARSLSVPCRMLSHSARLHSCALACSTESCSSASRLPATPALAAHTARSFTGLAFKRPYNACTALSTPDRLLTALYSRTSPLSSVRQPAPNEPRQQPSISSSQASRSRRAHLPRALVRLRKVSVTSSPSLLTIRSIALLPNSSRQDSWSGNNGHAFPCERATRRATPMRDGRRARTAAMQQRCVRRPRPRHPARQHRMSGSTSPCLRGLNTKSFARSRE